MKRILFSLVCFTCVFLNAKSQSTDPSIISSAGGSSKSSALSLDWTMGEYAVESITTSNKIFTQGFHQPLLISPTTNLKPISDGFTYNIVIAPNPITSIVNFSLTSPKNFKVSVTISDMSGIIFIQRATNSNIGSLQINMEAMRPGAYTLTVRDGVTGHLIKSYQIIKAQ